VTAIGVLLVGFGVLTAWSGFNRVKVWDLLAAMLGKGPRPAAQPATPGATP
jgi:hypothetical protein